MHVHFIDTSVLLNILDIPYRHGDRERVMKEFNKLNEDSINTLLLPLATIIETGNHIAYIENGDLRRSKGRKMASMLRDTVQGKAPWAYFEEEITGDDLLKISNEFHEMVMRKVGMGDLSIISAYKKYKETVPAIGYIRIWSVDNHLAAYEETMPKKRRRKT